MVHRLAAVNPRQATKAEGEKLRHIRMALLDVAEGRAILDYPLQARMSACLFYAAALATRATAKPTASEQGEQFGALARKIFELAERVASDAE